MYQCIWRQCESRNNSVHLEIIRETAKDLKLSSTVNKYNKYLLSSDVSNVQIILSSTRGKCLTLIIPCTKSRYLLWSNVAPLRDNKLTQIVTKFARLSNLVRQFSQMCGRKPGRNSTIRNALFAAYDTFVNPILFTTYSSGVYLRLLFFFLSFLD